MFPFKYIFQMGEELPGVQLNNCHFVGTLLFTSMANNQHDGEMIGLHNPANGQSC
jgi:hypothetical protein